jgi:hypothetical protein
MSGTDVEDLCADMGMPVDFLSDPEPVSYMKSTASGTATVKPSGASQCFPDGDWFNSDDAESIACNLEAAGTGIDLAAFSGPAASGDGTEGGVKISGSSEVCYEVDLFFDDVLHNNDSFMIMAWIM